MTTHHRKTKFVCAKYHKLDRNYTHMEDGSSMGLSFTIPNMYATTCKHTIYVYMRHGISYTIHDIYNTHYRTYNTWYLYAHKCTHLLRACCLVLALYSISICLCISVYIFIRAPSSNINMIWCKIIAYTIYCVTILIVAHVTWGLIS